MYICQKDTIFLYKIYLSMKYSRSCNEVNADFDESRCAKKGESVTGKSLRSDDLQDSCWKWLFECRMYSTVINHVVSSFFINISLRDSYWKF